MDRSDDQLRFTLTTPDGEPWAASEACAVQAPEGIPGEVVVLRYRLRKGANAHLGQVRTRGPFGVDLVLRAPDGIWDLQGVCYHSRTKGELVLSFAGWKQR